MYFAKGIRRNTNADRLGLFHGPEVRDGDASCASRSRPAVCESAHQPGTISDPRRLSVEGTGGARRARGAGRMLAGTVLAMFFGNFAAMATLITLPWQLALLSDALAADAAGERGRGSGKIDPPRGSGAPSKRADQRYAARHRAPGQSKRQPAKRRRQPSASRRGPS
jgi:hypothetical protein